MSRDILGIERISWKAICHEFNYQFEKLCLNKKVHFDSCCGRNGQPEVITFDGVTNKWRNAFLLDAIICNYFGQHDDHVVRRGFDHHSCLRYCVANAVSIASKETYIPICSDVLTDISSPWGSFSDFLELLKSQSHSKQSTKEKVQLMCIAFSPKRFPGLSLPNLLNIVVEKIWVSVIYDRDLITRQLISARYVDDMLVALNPINSYGRVFELRALSSVNTKLPALATERYQGSGVSRTRIISRNHLPELNPPTNIQPNPLDILDEFKVSSDLSRDKLAVSGNSQNSCSPVELSSKDINTSSEL